MRWLVLLLSLLWVGFYFAFRQREAWMDAICRALVRPWHRWMGRAADFLPFSLAECLGWGGGLLALWALVRLVRLARRRPRDWRALDQPPVRGRAHRRGGRLPAETAAEEESGSP